MSEAASRPGAKGHRFGPELVCIGCGVTWEAHQTDPQSCVDSIESQKSLVVDDQPEISRPERKAVGLAAAAPAGLQAGAAGTD